MRPIFRTLIALVYLASSTLAQAGFLINSYVFAASGPSITFLQCSTVDDTNLTTYTFTAQNTGTASADRRTLVSVHAEDGNSVFTVSTVTIGGDSATSVVDEGATARVVSSAIFIFTNTAGTSEDVVVTFSESVTSARVCLWQANNLASNTATDSISRETAGSNALNLGVTVNATGIAVGACTSAAASDTFTWAVFTESADTGGTEHSATVADFTQTGATGNAAATCAAGTGPNTGVSASFL